MPQTRKLEYEEERKKINLRAAEGCPSRKRFDGKRRIYLDARGMPLAIVIITRIALPKNIQILPIMTVS